MDQITHEVRLANWKSIIEQCQTRPEGQTAKQWLREHGINEKNYYYWQRKVRQEVYDQATSAILPTIRNDNPITFAEIPIQQFQNREQAGLPFHADAVIHTRTFTVGLSNSVSESLLRQVLEAVHAD